MVIDKIALALAIIGALNWGGIGLFGFDTVAFLCGGQMAILSRIIYALVCRFTSRSCRKHRIHSTR